MEFVQDTSRQADLRRELADVIRWFHTKGWAPATSANYSFRNPAPEESTYTISRSGVDKGAFEVDDFLVVDQRGQPLEAYRQWKPSAETLLHAMLYQQPGVNAVLHTHSVVNTVVSRWFLREKGISISGFELLKGLEGITTHDTAVFLPIFENMQDMAALCLSIENRLGDNFAAPGFLLAGHGLYAWGNSIAAAKRHVEAFEFLMECEYWMSRK